MTVISARGSGVRKLARVGRIARSLTELANGISAKIKVLAKRNVLFGNLSFIAAAFHIYISVYIHLR